MRRELAAMIGWAVISVVTAGGGTEGAALRGGTEYLSQ